MDSLLALAVGINAKLYDDMVDGDSTLVDTTWKTQMETFQVAGITTLCVRNSVFALFTCLIVVVNCILDPSAFSGEHESSLLALIPLWLSSGISWQFPYLADLFYVVLLPLFIGLEDIVFGEEYKYRLRAGLVVASLVVLTTPLRDWFSSGFQLLLWFVTGYFTTSVLNKLLRVKTNLVSGRLVSLPPEQNGIPQHQEPHSCDSGRIRNGDPAECSGERDTGSV